MRQLIQAVRFTLSRIVLASPFKSPELEARDRTSIEWIAIGDSWTPGVSYKHETDYDTSHGDACLRLNNAYSALMAQDNSSVYDSHTQDFHFLACAGALFC
jgi:hypothetical protein